MGKDRIVLSNFLLLASLSMGTACNSRSESGLKVVGGEVNVDRHQATALIETLSPGDEGLCTGTFIRPHVVLTAAHCLEGNNMKPNLIKVSAMVDGNVKTSKAKKFKIHPKYNGETANPFDAAVIHLKKKIGSQTMELAPNPPSKGQKVTVIGFGLTFANDVNSNPDDLRHIGENKVHQVTPQHILLQSKKLGKKTAGIGQGDSGGPLITSEGKIAGIASASRAAIGNRSGVTQENPLESLYVNINNAPIKNFIKKQLKSPGGQNNQPSGRQGAPQNTQGSCQDIPPDQYTCEEQKTWDKCQADWMLDNNWCAKTCGRC